MRSWFIAVVLFFPAAGWSAEGWTAFPRSGEVFQELLADPRQVQLAAQYYRQSGMDLGDVALGHSWGLARWQSAGAQPWTVQYDVEGMAYSRFRLTSGSNDFETVDFFANLPVEIRRGPVSGKFMIFHESSHLGDDYIRSTGDLGTPYSIDGLRGLLDYTSLPGLRLYAGAFYLLHTLPAPQRTGAQGGFEIAGPVRKSARKLPHRFYLAEDVQSRGSTAWNLDSETVVGMRLGIKDFDRSMRFFLGYFTGHSPFGQFYEQREDHFFIGLAFDF
jgi:hypothetical protein